MKRLLVIIQTYGLVVLVSLTALSFVLAVIEAMESSAQTSRILALAYSLQETFNSDADTAEGWTRVMHTLLTASLGWAAVRLYATTVGLKWDTFMARHIVSGHLIIVAGRSKQSSETETNARTKAEPVQPDVDKSALAIDLALSLAATQSVVLSLPEIDEGDRDKLWQAGVTVLGQDLAMPEVLKVAGARRARMLIAMRDDFADNVVVTRAAVSPSLDNPLLECKCMLEPLEVKRQFRLDDYFEAPTLPRIRIFNESELIARRILRDHPPDLAVGRTNQRVHVLLVGLGSVGQSVMLQIARMGHYKSGIKPKVTVVDRNVKLHWKSLLKGHPAVADLISVETEETRIEDVGQQELERWLQDEHPISIAYVCTKNEIANLRIARILLRELPKRQQLPADVVVLDPAGGCVLSEFATHGAHQGHLRLFSLVKSDSRTERSNIAGGLLSEIDDNVARLLHEEYCAEDDRSRAQDPSRQRALANRPWGELDETIRDANRYVADHFEVKLRAVGCKLAPLGEGVAANLTTQEMELLARMEHDRWWADRALAGWTLAPVRNNDLKQHPNMVPYEELSEEIKQLDRDSIVKLRAILAASGTEVVRSEETPL